MFTLLLFVQLMSGTTQVLKINPEKLETVIKLTCPGDTDFEPGFLFKVKVNDVVVDVPFYPCMEAAAIQDRTHERTALLAGKRTFVVGYYVPNKNWLLAPSLFNSQPLYKAQITIYEVVAGIRKRVGGPFMGVWTEKGCEEDDPVNIVKTWMSKSGK
jgi:hypothetical protein